MQPSHCVFKGFRSVDAPAKVLTGHHVFDDGLYSASGSHWHVELPSFEPMLRPHGKMSSLEQQHSEAAPTAASAGDNEITLEVLEKLVGGRDSMESCPSEWSCAILCKPSSSCHCWCWSPQLCRRFSAPTQHNLSVLGSVADS